MEYSPPPLFKQGPSALARLVIFVALSLALLVSDARFKTLEVLRGVIGAGLYPLQRAALVPRDFFMGVADFAVTSSTLRADNTQLHARNLLLSQQANKAAALDAENARLRAILQLSQRVTAQTTPADIQYDTRDPFTQKVVLGRGWQQGIQNGSPVVSEDGVIGQVTRVFPLQSEVTLLTDKDQAVPVEIVRTGLRSVIYGTAQGALLDLRFVPISADVQVGDELVTSGLDGVYPQGLPVAKVLRVDKQADTAFARVICEPIAIVRGASQVLVLNYARQVPPRPEDAEQAAAEAKEARKKAEAKKAAEKKAADAKAAEAKTHPDATVPAQTDGKAAVAPSAAATTATTATTPKAATLATAAAAPATAGTQQQKPGAAPSQPAAQPDRAVAASPAAARPAQQRATHAGARENP